MISVKNKSIVAAATVRFPEKIGQGVLIAPGFIVTAAHVLKWELEEGGMALGDDARYLQKIETGGRRMSVYPIAIEPLSDIAICGEVDGQWLPDECQAFADFCEVARPLRLDTREFPVDKQITAYVLTHTGQWVDCRVRQIAPQANTLFLETRGQIEGGTSGGPIVSENGSLLGVISHIGGSASDPLTYGWFPRPHLSAPVWVARDLKRPASATKKDASK